MSAPAEQNIKMGIRCTNKTQWVCVRHFEKMAFVLPSTGVHESTCPTCYCGWHCVTLSASVLRGADSIHLSSPSGKMMIGCPAPLCWMVAVRRCMTEAGRRSMMHSHQTLLCMTIQICGTWGRQVRTTASYRIAWTEGDGSWAAADEVNIS